MKNKQVIFIAAGLVIAMACSARGELITIEIEAVVDTVEDDGPGDGYLDGQISVGDIITGHYTYESTTPDTNPSDQVGDYWHYSSPYGVFLSVGGFDFQTILSNVNFVVEIINNSTTGGLHDAYGLISYNNATLTNGTLVDGISWWLSDYTANAISSTSLPITYPELGDWLNGNHLRLEGERMFLIDAHVTSAVPEPMSILLLGLGTLLLKKRN